MLLAAFTAVESQAQDTATWTGGGGNGNWTTSGNWNGGFVPNGNDIINFAGNTNLTTTMNLTGGALNQYRLFFNSGAGAFTLNGSSSMTFFDFGGNAPKIENNSASTQTINFPVALNGTGSGGAGEINPVNGDLLFGNTVDLAGTTQLRIFGNNGKSVTFSGVISSSGNGGANTVAINQNSTVIYGAANTYTGDTFINAGTLQFNAGGSASSSILRLGNTSGAAAATLAVASGANVNSTLVVRPGASGTKTVNGLAASGTSTVSGSIFLDADLTTASSSGGTLAFTGSAFDLKNQTLTVSGAGATTIGGVVQNSTGSGKLTKTGSGTLTLSGPNSYTGATTISAGAVNIQHASALGTVAAGTSVAAGAALQIQGGITTLAEALTLNGTGVSADGALRNMSGNNSYAGLVTLGSATRIHSDAGTLTLSHTGTITGATFGLTVGGAGNTTINSIIGNTTGGLTKDGASTLTLTAASTYTGATTINGGTLRLASAAERLSNSTDMTIAAGAFFDLNGFSETIDALSGAGTITSGAAGTVTLALGAANTVGGAAFSGIIQNGSGTVQLDKIGAGTQTLSGASTYAGRTHVQDGVLSVDVLADGGVASPIGASSNAATSLQIGTLTTTGTLRYTGSGHSTDRLFHVVGSTGVVESSGTGPLNFTNTGSLIVSGGTFQSFVLGGTNTGSNTFAPAVPNPPSHNTTLTKSGTGTWIVTGNSTFTGATVFDEGILETATLTNSGVSGPLGAGTGLTFQGGTLRYTGTGDSTNRVLSQFRGGTIDSSGTGPIHFTNATSSFIPNGGPFVLTLTGNNTGGTNTFSQPMLNNGTIDLVKSGTNTWALDTAQTYTGTTTISGGTLQISAAGSLGSGAYAGAIANSGTLQYSSSATQTFSGIISGTGALVKDTAASTLTLTGANTYTGTTTVSAGSLEAAATNALGGTSNVTINTGGTLLLSGAGTNRINNAATITMAGGKIAFSGNITEGSSPGTGALTLTANCIIDFAGGNVVINFADSSAATWTGGATLSIYNWGGSLSGGGNDQLKFGNTNTALTSSQLAQIKFYSGLGTGFLGFGGFVGSFGEVVPVPEPSSVFTGLGMFALAGWRERRRARALGQASREAAR